MELNGCSKKLIDLWQPAVPLSDQSLCKGAGNRHWEDSILTATDSADLVSIPALLARNAREFGDKAAYREKEFGIWQSWTWVEAVEQVEALALGLGPAFGQRSPATLPAAQSLPEELARAIQNKQPLVVMVSLDGCAFCRQAKRPWVFSGG